MRIRGFLDFINEGSENVLAGYFDKKRKEIIGSDDSLASEVSISLEVPSTGALWVMSIVESGVECSSSLYLMEIYDYDVNEFKKNPTSKGHIAKGSKNQDGIGCGIAHYQKYWFDPEVIKKTGSREIIKESEEVFVYKSTDDFIPELFVRLFNEIGVANSGKMPSRIKKAMRSSSTIKDKFPDRFISAYNDMIKKCDLPLDQGYFKSIRKDLFKTGITDKCIDSFNQALKLEHGEEKK
jgi:hypothetical protein